MESLLPSEVARLVLGYLEDQKCDEAAKAFLQTSSHLQECRTVVSNGKRFSTRVNGFTLLDILEKFSAANAIIQERLSRLADCEQLKHCGDLLEQLRFLVEGSRAQRFVVNINVPPQTSSQSAGGSPIISSSIRKRHHSGSDRERCKRVAKSFPQIYDKQYESVSSQLGCDTIEATPLESLPGHADLLASHDSGRLNNSERGSGDGYCTSNKNDTVNSITKTQTADFVKETSSVDSCSTNQKNKSSNNDRETYEPEPSNFDKDNETGQDAQIKPFGVCMGTSTDELAYTSAEVQTTPYDIQESESESNDEPIENLSLLTKELLNRTELQERIADNINKAILPGDASFKDESLCESMGGELNTSIMSELNNAIKSIVQATETDPVFEQFFEEIIGPNIEPDTSPDEEIDSNFNVDPSKEVSCEKHVEAVVEDTRSQEPGPIATKSTSGPSVVEIPLKHRLRSSSRQQNTRVEDETDKLKEREKEESALHDQNAAAILSIINVNMSGEIINDGKRGHHVLNEQICLNTETEKISEKREAQAELHVKESVVQMPEASSMPVSHEANVAMPYPNNTVECKSTRKNPIKKPKPTKPKHILENDAEKLISEQEMMAMPTLIVCSKEEVTSLLKTNSNYHAANSGNISSSSSSHFIPIAPKDPLGISPPEKIYLRAVNVCQKVAVPPDPIEVKLAQTEETKVQRAVQSSKRKPRKVTKKLKNTQVVEKPVQSSMETVTISDTPSVMNTSSEIESITLYGNENSAGTTLENANMPPINLDESISLCGTGLSPFLKFHDKAKQPQHETNIVMKPANDVIPESNRVETAVQLPKDKVGEEQISIAGRSSCDVITKRTPRSLLKSRSKNYRLSMSTPRRRSSHVRALDFTTPTKVTSSGRRLSTNESVQFSPKSSNRSKSVCRTTLFKSPPFVNSPVTVQKLKSPLKICRPCKVPIATRSPAPKLMGGWEKYTGVGMILGGTSPHSNSRATSPSKNHTQASTKEAPVIKKSWDADLRKILQASEEKEEVVVKTTKATKKRESTKDKLSSATSKKEVVTKKNAKSAVGSNKVKNDQTDEIIISDKSSDSCTKTIDNDVIKEITSVQDIITPSNTNVNKVEVPVPTSLCSDTVQVQDEKDSLANKNDTSEKKVVKKYAKLKTIKTNISKPNSANIIECMSNSIDLSVRTSDLIRISPESSRHILQLPHMIDLETPRKIENSFGLPPTPRVLSPSKNVITPFVKVSEDSSKVRSFVTTPEFPPTPCVTLTPKLAGENTEDAIRKGEFNTCSPYYHPSSEQPTGLDKILGCQSTHTQNKLQQPEVSIIPVDAEDCRTNINMHVVSGFPVNVPSSKLEITQFEVIKENLPKEEAVKELKISATSKDTADKSKNNLPAASNMTTNDCITEEEIKVVNISQINIRCDSSSRSDHESSDSDSSSSSNSTSSSSSSSSSDSGTTNPSPLLSVIKNKETLGKIYTDTSHDSGHKAVPEIINVGNTADDNPPVIEKTDKSQEEVAKKLEETSVPNINQKNNDNVLSVTNLIVGAEESPAKVFPVVKSDEVIRNTSMETPAKDEALLSEADISETPSSSKAGMETLTNLSSKISALISAQDPKATKTDIPLNQTLSSTNKTTAKPKIIDVQCLVQAISVTGEIPEALSFTKEREPQVSHSSQSSSQSSAQPDCKLGLELEKKRLRIISKLKTKPQLPVVPKGVRAKRVPAAKKEKPVNVKVNTENNEDQSKNNVIKRRKSQSKPPVNILKKELDTAEVPKDHSLAETTRTILRQTTIKETTGVKEESKKEKHESSRVSSNVRGQSRSEAQTCPNANINKRKNSTDLTKSKSKTVKNEKKKDNKPKESTVKNSEGSEQTCDNIIVDNVLENKIEKVHSSNEEKILNSKEQINSNENTKRTLKSKVDQVKRDLFSDDENNDQRTTRSRTRQISDAQKSDCGGPNTESSSSAIKIANEKNFSVPSKEDLSCVLESLQLVPANKHTTVETDGIGSLNATISNTVEYRFVHDDSVPVKKRRRKFRSSELRFQVTVDSTDEKDKERGKMMTATPYEEIFNISPKSKRKVVNKRPALKSIKCTKPQLSTLQNSSSSVFKGSEIKPLATSSPMSEPSTSGTTKIHGKNPLSSGRKSVSKSPDGKRKQTVDNAQDPPKDDRRKRKASELRESEQVEKKARATDPQVLLSMLNVDEFLTSVHGPT